MRAERSKGHATAHQSIAMACFPRCLGECVRAACVGRDSGQRRTDISVRSDDASQQCCTVDADSAADLPGVYNPIEATFLLLNGEARTCLEVV